VTELRELAGGRADLHAEVARIFDGELNALAGAVGRSWAPIADHRISPG
jgi:hypothetical protein